MNHKRDIFCRALLCFFLLTGRSAAEGLLDNAAVVLDVPGLAARPGITVSPLSLLSLRTPVLEGRARYDDLYRETDGTRSLITAARYATEMTGAALIKAPVGGVAAIGAGTDRLLLDADDGYSHQRYDESRTWRCAAYARNFKNRLQAGFALLQNTAPDSRWNHTVELRLLPVRSLTAGYTLRQWNSRAAARFALEDMDMQVPLEYAARRHRLAFGANGPLAGAGLEYHFSTLGNDSAAGTGYSTVPELEDHCYGIKWHAGPRHGFTIHMQGQAYYLDGVIRLYSDGVKFGKVTRTRYERQAVTGHLTRQHPRYKVTAGGGTTRADGTFDGSIESWPFTTAVAGLLGARRYFRMEGSMRTDIITAEGEYTVRPGHRAGISLRHLSYYPHGKGTLWNTVLMGLGITGLEHYDLTVTTARILDCGADYRLKYGKTDLTIRISQLVPLAVSYKQDTPSTGSGSTGSGKSSSRRVRGGTSIAADAVYRF